MGDSAQAQIRERVRSMVGPRIAGVVYFELGVYSDPGPAWDRDPDFDELDFGLELRLDDGDAYWISWGNAIYAYALSIEVDSTEDRRHMRQWDVSSNSRWQPLIGRAVTRAQIYWDWEQMDSGPRRWGLQDLELTIEGGRVVYTSALSIEPDREPFGHADSITVVTDEAVARRYAIGPFAQYPYTAPGDWLDHAPDDVP